jgi:CheY-like chemotaxis protein
MNREEIYKILQSISLSVSSDDDTARPLPEKPEWSASLEDLDIDMISAQEYFRGLEDRIPTKNFHVPPNLIEKLHLFGSLGELVDFILEKGFAKRPDLEVVYVDDEAENLFVFKRRFAKSINLKTFENPTEALEYILASPNVGLVITDEVMPSLTGNQLCDTVKKSKPNMKFILITGNPNQDDDLMYKSLRKSRFYEFINKPMDLQNKGDEYLAMIKNLMAFDG